MLIAGNDFARINRQIRVPQVRVIGPDGEQFGILQTEDALSRAQGLELDLVEVAPNSTPPVCRIMDYGKYQYEKSKKEKEGKKKQHQVQVKEIRLSPKTDTHDLGTKLKNARKFLEQRNKVKFSVRFRGREMAYQELGRNMLDKVVANLEDVGEIEAHIKMEGRRMTLTLSSKL